jgi:hypothetical protein
MPLSVEDRLAIHELLALHGHLSDDQQHERLEELFTPDATYDLEKFGAGIHCGIDQLRALATGDAAQRGPVAHHVTNVIIREDTDGTVRVKSKGLGILLDGRVGSVVYDDVVVSTERGWRIAYRVVTHRAG